MVRWKYLLIVTLRTATHIRASLRIFTLNCACNDINNNNNNNNNVNNNDDDDNVGNNNNNNNNKLQ